MTLQSSEQTIWSFLGTVVLIGSGALAGCCHQSLTSQPPAMVVRGNGASDRLRLLTWNVWLMPSWTFQSPHNVPRAAAIAGVLLENEFDVVCLQKVFDDEARELLVRRLKYKFPYQYGPANACLSLK